MSERSSRIAYIQDDGEPVWTFENPPGTFTPTESDVAAIEALSDAAIRSGHTQAAIEGYALALRLRNETGLHPKRRASDEPST